jgi:hypothetical protein
VVLPFRRVFLLFCKGFVAKRGRGTLRKRRVHEDPIRPRIDRIPSRVKTLALRHPKLIGRA